MRVRVENGVLPTKVRGTLSIRFYQEVIGSYKGMTKADTKSNKIILNLCKTSWNNEQTLPGGGEDLPVLQEHKCGGPKTY